MNLNKSLIGRRQFLAAAGVTSASALAIGKFGGAAAPISGASEAMAAAEKNKTADDNASSNKYGHLLSPLRIGNVILKNRMYSMNATVHFLQGPENFPAEESRYYAANIAKNGAAIVTCRISLATIHKVSRNQLPDDSAHMVVYDLEDTGVQNYLDQMVEAIHCYGAKACVPYYVLLPEQDTIPPGPTFPVDPLSGETLQKLIDGAVTKAKFFQAHGFDMARLDMLRYKGDVKTRASFAIKICEAIKKACGQDFLIDTSIRITDSPEGEEGANTIKDAIKIAKMWEGLVDILSISGFGGYFSERNDYPQHLRYAQAIKESGAKIAVTPYGGFQDLDLNEEHIATGKADIIGMGRIFIADWEYGKKAYEGRGDDVTPCIECNKCHGLDQKKGPWFSVCSVNPRLGIKLAAKMVEAPTVSRKVAVIGGGPAGMKAAITAADRGHKVVLYEKGDALGGLLRHADYSPYKWNLKEYKDYLVRQVKKKGIEVLLNTKATPEMIKAKGYDAIMVALGAEPIIPGIPGVEAKNVFNVVDAYPKEKTLGRNVVLIGGGEFGTETGMFLSKSGHKVTAITGEKQLVEVKGPHQQDMMIQAYEQMEDFSFITEANVTGISDGEVKYKEAKGRKKTVKTDSVVVYAGLKPRMDEAMKFSGLAVRFFVIGDCGDSGGSVQKSTRNAFFAASQI